MAVNKNWVSSEITNRIQPFVNGNYQESVNIVRLMPDATEKYGQIYTTWANALHYSSTAASDTHYITINIQGGGAGSSYITMGLDNNKYVADYVHFRGMGSGIGIVSDANISTGQFEATNLGYVNIEDLIFTFLNVMRTNDAVFKNIVFKNCTFAGYARTVTFIDCLFLGTNYFEPIVDDMFIFTNSPGIIYTTKNVITNGVNNPTIYTPTTLGVGTQILKDNGSALEISSSISAKNDSYVVGNSYVSHDAIITGNVQANAVQGLFQVAEWSDSAAGKNTIYYSTDAHTLVWKNKDNEIKQFQFS